jgi:hypothetical protein
MTVGELKEKLKDIPDHLNVLAEGKEADKVIVEECQGNKYVRIFKAWDVEFVGRGIETKAETEAEDGNDT